MAPDPAAKVREVRRILHANYLGVPRELPIAITRTSTSLAGSASG
jgi:hypothetical protein